MLYYLDLCKANVTFFCSNDYEEINRLEGHENEVKCCAFSPSGEYLATCSRDKSVWFWQCKCLMNNNQKMEILRSQFWLFCFYKNEF